MNSLWAVTLATMVKDIRLEWRSKDALNSMLFFSLLVVVIFMFSFDPLAEESRHIVGGLVWVGFFRTPRNQAARAAAISRLIL